MSDLIKITKGLKSTIRHASDYTLSQALLELDKYTDNYELLKPDYNRLYGDIDGKDIQGTEEEFNAIDLSSRTAIETFLKGEDYALMTASSFIHKKVSWRFVIKNRKATLEDNKKWVQASIADIALPEGVKFDSAPYGKNQKIRMLKSNKDGENRPLRLVKGEVLDTLISYIPEDCELMEMPKESKTKAKTKKLEQPAEDRLSEQFLQSLVLNITNDATLEWEQWYKVAQAIFNEGGSEELFLTWSSKSPKHNEREAVLQWRSLKNTSADGQLTVASLFYWSRQSNLEQHNRIIQENAPIDSYYYKKFEFEQTHFKLMNPPRYIRQIDGNLQYLCDGELNYMYRNNTTQKKTDKGDIVQQSFTSQWTMDKNILTYEKLEFKPNQPTTPGCYNLFHGFPMEAVEGDWSIIHELLWDLSGRDQDIYDYILNWSAHIFQKPYEKPEVVLIFSSFEEGVGKDTYGDHVLRPLLSDDYYYTTSDAENDFFGRFTTHLQNKLLVKLEEMNYDVFNKHDDKFKSWITAPTRSYEEKGVPKGASIQSYHRFIGTTNEACPVKLSKTFRRYLLVNPYQAHAGKTDHWERIYAGLKKKETLQAFLYHLLHLDISNWNPRRKLETDALKEARQSQAPPLARYFQSQVQLRGDDENETTMSWLAKDLLERVNASSKYPYSPYKLAQELKQFPQQMVHTRRGAEYTFNIVELTAFLRQRSWWVDGF